MYKVIVNWPNASYSKYPPPPPKKKKKKKKGNKKTGKRLVSLGKYLLEVIKQRISNT